MSSDFLQNIEKMEHNVEFYNVERLKALESVTNHSFAVYEAFRATVVELKDALNTIETLKGTKDTLSKEVSSVSAKLSALTQEYELAKKENLKLILDNDSLVIELNYVKESRDALKLRKECTCKQTIKPTIESVGDIQVDEITSDVKAQDGVNF